MLASSLFGCAATPHAAVVEPWVRRGEPARTPNLVFGRTPQDAWLATQIERGERPAAAIGYRFGQPSFSDETIYDDQLFFDRLGGSYYRSSVSQRTDVWLR